MRHRWILLAFAATAIIAPASARASSGTECVPLSAAETMAIARSHLDAYTHPATAPFVPLAPGARRTELPPILPNQSGGPVAATSAEEMHAYYLAAPTVRFIERFDEFRWVIDLPNCEATVFFMLDYKIGPVEFDIHLGQRFRVSGGQIHEIEVITWRATPESGSCWPAGSDPDEGTNGPCPRLSPPPPPYGPTPGCNPTTREQTVASARSYLDALVSNDASHVPLAASARRSEIPAEAGDGPVTGTSGPQIAATLVHDPRYASVSAIREVRWYTDVARCMTTAFYMVDRPLDATYRPGSWHHVTRFLVSGGVIREIEDISHRPIDASRYEGSCWPQTWSDPEDEAYRLLPCPAAS